MLDRLESQLSAEAEPFQPQNAGESGGTEAENVSNLFDRGSGEGRWVGFHC